jgi:hypothetical protein
VKRAKVYVALPTKTIGESIGTARLESENDLSSTLTLKVRKVF